MFGYYLVALAAIVALTDAHSCSPQSCNGQLHTLCAYPSPQPSPQCNQVKSAHITKAEEQEIVNSHNKLRNKVANGQERQGIRGGQPAGVIPPLQWDPELANVAQRWANQCQFGHDQCRVVDRFAVGQNVAYSSHSAQFNGKFSEMVQGWYDEVKDFDASSVYKFKWQSYPQIGHYTQLVWGTTTHVGCGATRYKDYDGWYTTYLVCNYGPAGNYINEPMYKTK